MRKQILLFGFVLILFASSVLGTTIFEDDFDRPNNDTVGNGWTETEVSASELRILDNQLSIQDTVSGAPYAQINNSFSTITSDSINVKFDLTFPDDQPFDVRLTSGTDACVYLFMDDTGFLKNLDSGVSGNVASVTAPDAFNLNLKNINFTSNTFEIFIDDISQGTFGVNLDSCTGIDGIRYVNAFAYGSSQPYYIDNLTICDSECLEPISDFQLTASNYYNDSSITTFYANITNSTSSQNISTNNGTIYWNYNDIVNITVIVNNYFNRTYMNWNTSTNLDSEHWQAILYAYALENYTNMTISVFNNTVGSQFNTSSGGFTTHYLNADTYNYTANAAGDYAFNSTGNVTLSTLEIKNITIGFLPYELNVSAKEYFSNSTINNFTVQIYNTDYGVLYNITTTTGLAQVYGVNGTYNISIFTNDYADQTALVNITQVSQNKTFYLFTTNSVYFRFYNEVLLDLLNGYNVSAELISDVYADNYSTTNGTIYVDLLSPSIYTVRTQCTGFDERFYEFTLTNNTNTIIDIYLVNTSNADYQATTITVYDENLDEVENAVIKVLRYDIDSNTYTIREIIRTNFEGQAIIDLIKNEEWYKFIIEYNGVEKLVSEKTQIYATDLSFQINVGSNVGENFFYTQAVVSDVSYLNSSDQFRFSFNDPNNQVTRGCLYVYQYKAGTRIAIGNSCATGTSGVVYQAITPENETSFIGIGYVYFGSTERTADMDSVKFSSVESFGYLAWLMVAIFTIFIILAPLGDLTDRIFVAPMPLLIFSVAGIVALQWQYAAGLEIVAIIIGLAVKKSR